MSWIRLDDGWIMGKKMQDAGPLARELWHAGMCHCNQQLTDGVIEKRFLPILALQAQVPKTKAKVLVEVGLWLDHGDHWEVARYLEFQPSRADVEADRADARERQRIHREKKRREKEEAEALARNAVTSQESHTVTSPVTTTVSHSPPSRPDPSPTTSSIRGNSNRPAHSPVDNRRFVPPPDIDTIRALQPNPPDIPDPTNHLAAARAATRPHQETA